MTEKLTDEQLPMPDWAELWMAINGAGAESAERQAHQFMASTLEGLTISMGVNSEIVRRALVDQFKFAEARAAVALRAERAKATQSDDAFEALVRDCAHGEYDGQNGASAAIARGNAIIASIRAEGSAERAKLEAALRKFEHDFC